MDIKYFPPPDAPLYPDPVDMCASGHRFLADYNLVIVDNTDGDLGETIYG